MVYKEHEIWRDEVGLDSAVFDLSDLSEDQKELVYKMQDSQPVIPYTLEIECTDYWGSFEREFIAYSLGILDDVQMDIRYAEEYLEMFWQEVFGRSHLDFEYALEHYVLLQDYLFETFQECDDWEQLTFYSIDWSVMHKDRRDVLKIQLAKPFDVPYCKARRLCAFCPTASQQAVLQAALRRHALSTNQELQAHLPLQAPRPYQSLLR